MICEKDILCHGPWVGQWWGDGAQQELLLPPGTFTGEVRRPIDDTIEELGGAPSIVNVYYHNFTNYFITYFDSTI